MTRRLAGRLTATASVQALGVVGGAAVSLLTFAILARDLGPGGFGALAAATAYLAIPSLFADAGLSTAVLRQISRDPDGAEAAIRASLPVRLLLSAGLCVVAVATSQLLPFNDGTRTAILIGSVGVLLTLTGNGLLPIFQAEMRMTRVVASGIAGRIVTLAAVGISVRLELGLTGAAWAYVAGAAVTAAAMFAVTPARFWRRPRLDRRYAAGLMREATTLSVASGVGLVAWRVDSVMISLLRNAREVGLYTAAYKFVDLTAALLTVIPASAFPSMSRFVAERDARLKPLMRKTYDLILVAAIPAVVLAVVHAPEIIALAAGDEYSEAATALRLLAVVCLATSLSSLLERGLIAAGDERALLSLNVAAVALNIGLNLALVPPFGYVAAAAATLVSEAAWVVAAAVLFRRRLGFLPSPDSTVTILACALALAAIVISAPGPVVATAAGGVLAYVALLAVLPGTVRDLVRDLLQPARRPRLS